jgi:signal transduction histidine kinase
MTLGPRTIRAKLTLTTMLVMGTLLALLAFIVDFGARQTLLGSVEQDTRERAEDFASMRRRFPRRPPGFGGPRGDRGPDGGSRGQWQGPVLPMGGPPPEGGPEPSPAASLSLIRPRVIPISSRDGRRPPDEPYDKAAFERGVKGQAGHSTVMIEGEPVRIYSQPVYEDGRIQAVVQVPYPLGDILRSLDNLRRILLTVVIPFGVVLAGVASLYLVDRLMRPLRIITGNAEAIGANSLAERLPVVGRDEFASLAVTLNRMLDRLESAFRLERATSRRLEEALHQQRRFTADASHELKTPLAVIKANAGLMLHLGDPSEENRESVAAIDEAANRMNRLVQDLLTLARAEAGQLAVRFEPCDLGEAVRRAVDHLGATDVQVRLRLPDEPVVVEGSLEDLARVFVNLIDNARRHSGTEAPVEVSVTAEGAQAVAMVRDRGQGIAPEHLEHLFERFYRTDRSRTAATGGTGLGLAICRGIVEAHGGKIEAESEAGEGTTFTVSLPVQEA